MWLPLKGKKMSLLVHPCPHIDEALPSANHGPLGGLPGPQEKGKGSKTPKLAHEITLRPC